MFSFNRTRDHNVGFHYSIDGRAARRQFNLSIGVVVILVIAILAAVLAFDRRSVSPGFAGNAPTSIQQAERAT